MGCCYVVHEPLLILRHAQLQMNVEELEDKYPSETISPESTRSASRADKGKGREGAW